MKRFVPILLAVISMVSSDAKEPDPFAVPPAPPEADRSKDKPSPEFIDDEHLKKLGEPRLDKGTGKDGPGLIRITILRSFDGPLVFTWFPPAGEAKKSSINVKRLKMHRSPEGTIFFDGLDIDKKVEITEAQTKNLYTVLEGVNFDALPQECYQGEVLDGSLWVYERAARDGHTLLERHNPIIPAHLGAEPWISKSRLLQETYLTTFTLMLWTMSGIEDDRMY